ncbi:maestro heat-like repeat-containing protein family member 7 [Corvus kubaryi]|uniref:maestro heat-like repeat-containing protein family member 7 n=1 Tax=Corvus kubaryi TaxID=68294 RepID=UPI001C05D709|nr:maestro heat-like repeat-containing protein family member 7 [Corvus kubaryi]
MTRHLQSESREMHRLAIRGLMVLSKNPSMAKKMCSLSESLMELLRNADGEVVRMTLSVFLNVLLNKDILISSPTAPRLAEALRPLFNNDNSLVQLLSIQLFQEVMELVVEKGKKPLKRHVRQSLLPLFFHCHDENRRVAEASRETLLCAVRFLKRRDLKQLLKMEDSWSFCERLLAEDRSRAAEHLRQALPYLESRQEPLREAAIRSIGITGMLMKGQPEELQLICEALQALSTDDSPSNTNLIVQVMLNERAELLSSSSGLRQPGQHQIPCKRRPAGAPGTADAGHT